MSEISTKDKDAGKAHDDDHGHEHNDDHGPRIAITINGRPYEAPAPHMTGRELLALAGLSDANQMFLDVPGPGDDQPVGLDTPIKIRDGMAFYDVPVGTFG